MAVEQYMDTLGILFNKFYPPPSHVYNPYKKTKSYTLRRAESTRLLELHPDSIPIVVVSNDFVMKNYKFMVNRNYSFSKFMRLVREHCQIDQSDAIFCLINNKVYSGSIAMETIYFREREEDCFLYVVLSKEQTFGYKSV